MPQKQSDGNERPTSHGHPWSWEHWLTHPACKLAEHPQETEASGEGAPAWVASCQEALLPWSPNPGTTSKDEIIF